MGFKRCITLYIRSAYDFIFMLQLMSIFKTSTLQSKESPKEIVITLVKYCLGKNRSGLRCAHLVTSTDYCPLHSQLFRYSKPDDCPICTDSLEDEPQPLECGHWVHRSCMLNWKDRCPICMAKIRLTAKERALLPVNLPPSNEELDNQAIFSLLAQDDETIGDFWTDETGYGEYRTDFFNDNATTRFHYTLRYRSDLKYKPYLNGRFCLSNNNVSSISTA